MGGAILVVLVVVWKGDYRGLVLDVSPIRCLLSIQSMHVSCVMDT